MPIFGEYETVGEAHAITHARDYVATVWRVRKSGAGENSPFHALKCIAPRQHHASKPGDAEDKLEPDHSLEFVEVIKLVKKAQNEGGRGLAPIHAFGTSPEGAWYVTDFCERQSLKALVTRQGQVDDAALRHVVDSVVAGCLALNRSCSRSHGNLKLSNVLLGGRIQSLRKTPLLLVDPMPVPSATILRLANPDRHSVGGMVHDVFEAQDLKAIGELILQLVEGRVIESGFDYNYPIAASAAWDRLGKAGESWRSLCNRLLDPLLSLEQVNLKWLASQFKPASTGRYLVILGGVLVVAGVIAGGFYALRLKAAADFGKHLASARSECQAGDALGAAKEIRLALQKRPNDNMARELHQNIQSLLQQQSASSFAAGQQAEKQQQWSEAKNAFAKAATLAGESENPQPPLSAIQAEQEYAESMAVGQTAFANSRWEDAMTAANKALELKSGHDDAARDLLNQAKGMAGKANQEQAALAEARKLEQDYRAAMAEGTKALKASNYDQAIEEADAALKLKPDDEAALRLKADAKQQQTALATMRGREQAYQAAMNEGTRALTALNYSLAIQKADAALGFKPGDEAAARLKTSANKQMAAMLAAQEQDRGYQAAMSDGSNALKAADYSLAIQKADIALGFKPEDEAATRLKADAKRQQAALLAAQQQQQAYQTAMTDGRNAFNAADYNLAIQKAVAALGFKPGDEAATRLEADAKKQQVALAAAQERERAYQTALAAGTQAFKTADYSLAIEKSDAALGFKPGDEAATRLKADAKQQLAALEAAQQRETAYHSAMTEGTNALKALNYSLAIEKANAALAIKSQDMAASALLAQANQGKKVAEGIVQFASDIQNANKFKVADPGQAGKYLDDAARIKPLDQDAVTLLGEIKQLRSLDKQLEDLMKQYGVSPKVQVVAINPQNSSQKEYSTNQKTDFSLTDLDNLKTLRAKYKTGWLNPERTADFKLMEEKLVLNSSN